LILLWEKSHKNKVRRKKKLKLTKNLLKKLSQRGERENKLIKSKSQASSNYSPAHYKISTKASVIFMMRSTNQSPKMVKIIPLISMIRSLG
jgi:hypothetical protein